MKKEIKNILKKHKDWLEGESDGERANLQGANLRGADLQGADLQGANLQGANLQGANLRHADLQGAYLQGAYLRHADLRGADLQDANLRHANLQGAYLQGANLQGANLQGANLRHADLQGAYLQGAYLQGADLRHADLRGADLQDANLRHANLQGAYLQGADLQGADLDFSCFPLWCGGLDIHLDNRQLTQIAYHLVRNGLHSKNASEETKKELAKLIDFANRFHRVNECGEVDKNVQDKNGQNIQQSAGSETETGRDTGLLEDVSRCSGDNNNCWTADNVDDVKKL